MTSTDSSDFSTTTSSTNYEGQKGKRKNANKKASGSKERRKRYVTALERAVQNLRSTSASLSSQLNLLEEDTNGLSSKKKDLKLQMQSMENEVQLQHARNEALKKEIQELRAMVCQSIQNGNPTMSFPWSFGTDEQFQMQNLPENQFQKDKKETTCSDVDDSSDNSPSRETMSVHFNDYHLF